MIDEQIADVAASTWQLLLALQSGRPDDIARCYSPSADYSDPILGNLGIGSARRVWPLILAHVGSPRWRFSIEDVGLLSSRVRTRIDFIFAPTNRPVSLDISTALRVHENRVTSHTDTFDRSAWSAAFPFPQRLLMLTSYGRRRLKSETRRGLARSEETKMFFVRKLGYPATAASCLAATGFATSEVAQAQEFLRPADAVRMIMDGRPWSAQSSNGPNLKLSLNKDGTGSAQGPMPFALSISWEIKGEAVCLYVGPAGTKCVRFRQVAGGFEGWIGNQLDLKLTR